MTTKRLGTSLIELLVAMSVGSVVFLTSVGWLHQTMKLTSDQRSNLNDENQIRRLARILPGEAADSNRLTLDGSRVTGVDGGDRRWVVELRNKEVRRSWFRGDERISNERFALSTSDVAKWSRTDPDGPISLTITRSRPRQGANAEPEAADTIRLRLQLNPRRHAGVIAMDPLPGDIWTHDTLPGSGVAGDAADAADAADAGDRP